MNILLFTSSYIELFFTKHVTNLQLLKQAKVSRFRDTKFYRLMDIVRYDAKQFMMQQGYDTTTLRAYSYS